MSEEDVTERLQKPWGLKQLIMGKWPNYARTRRQSREEARLKVALWLVNHIERGGRSSDVIRVKINRIMELGNSNAVS